MHSQMPSAGAAAAPGESCSASPAIAVGVAETFGLRSRARALLVGDGNFSFADALGKLGTGCAIAATALETHEQLVEAELQDVVERIARLRTQGIAVGLGVDAMNLADSLPADIQGTFDVVIFQFPQHPERRKIHLQRQLLRGFFASASTHLAPEGSIVVSLCRGQGGTPAEEVPRKGADTWQVQEAAAEVGFILQQVRPCPVQELEVLGYQSTGFRNRGLRETNANVVQDRGFNYKGSLTHVFCRETSTAFAAFPLERRHDISFWEPEDFSEEQLQQALSQGVGPGVDLELEMLDQYCKEDGRRARTYRVRMSTIRRALTLPAFRKICEAVRDSISASASCVASTKGSAEGQKREVPGMDIARAPQ